jgi:hypothetical protein
MIIFIKHTIQQAKSKLHLSCNNAFKQFRHLLYARICTLTPSLPLQVGEGREGWGKKHDYLILPNNISIQIISLTKDLPGWYLANAMTGRPDVFTIKLKTNFYEKNH